MAAPAPTSASVLDEGWSAGAAGDADAGSSLAACCSARLITTSASV
jgi:hypothetical protein